MSTWARNPFVKKGYGRIYVSKPEHVEVVRQAIKAIDESEFTTYLGSNVIAVFEGKVELVYTHKFEIDIDTLTLFCIKQGVWIWCISQSDERFEVLDSCSYLVAEPKGVIQ